jgi:hypothetical protein
MFCVNVPQVLIGFMLSLFCGLFDQRADDNAVSRSYLSWKIKPLHGKQISAPFRMHVVKSSILVLDYIFPLILTKQHSEK